MDIAYLKLGNPDYPPALFGGSLYTQTSTTLSYLGNIDILKQKKTALFCSSRCPGDLIIKTHDLAKKWRDDGVTIISGFHSPMEKECLTILLRGKQPVIICPARGIERMRLKKEYKKSFDDGRLLLLSPFPTQEKRMTAETARLRNRFVAAIADIIFVAHASEGGSLEKLCIELAAHKRSLLTLAGEANTNLGALGARFLHTTA